MFIKYMIFTALCQVCFAAGEAAPTRYEQLEKAINGDMSFRIRAINEIGENIASKEYQQLLIKYLFSGGDGTDCVALNAAFLKADISIITQIIEYYKKSKKNDNDFAAVCRVLEKIGGPTELVKQFYLDESKRIPISQDKEAWLKICFLNRGIDSKNILKQLKIDLKDPTTPLARQKLEIMSWIGCQKYADKELIKILTQHVENSDAVISCYSALVLASLKTIQPKQLAVLEKNTKKSTNIDDYTDDYESTLIKNMCIAALDRKQSEERVKLVLYNIGCNGLFDYGGLFVLHSTCDLLVDKQMPEIIKKSLADSDPNIVRGALMYACCHGNEYKSTTPLLLGFLKNSQFDETRKIAAIALSFVAGQEQVSRLEKILKNEQSYEVREQILDTIHVLNMDVSYKKEKDIEGD